MDKLIRDKTYNFALKVLTLHRKICDEKNYYTLYEEFVHHGTRTGAEAVHTKAAEELADFVECYDKTLTELRLSMIYFEKIYEAKDVTEEEYNDIIQDAKYIENLILDSLNSIKAMNNDQPKSSS
jgi:hypothetical protein